MGLLDILNGMQNGPRGSRETAPGSPSESGGGMSPITMAILALLAYKAAKHIGGGQPGAAPASPAPAPDATTASGGGLLGGLGNLLQSGLGNSGLGGTLGGLLAGGAAGSVLSGGLGELIKQFQEHGHSEAANSWMSDGPNKQISPDVLANALGADQINTLVAQTGLSRDDLLSGLSKHLPEVVDKLTPDGRLPTEQEAARWL
jgi:uncharacterized protein YidB (DUF937 family)